MKTETVKSSKSTLTRIMPRFTSALCLSAVLLILSGSMAATTVTYGVGACGQVGLTSFATITEALEATPTPNIIKVCPGSYPEQVVITTPVTIEGISAENGSQPSITVPKGGLKINVNGVLGALAAQLFVDEATGPVNISNLTVDADGHGLSKGDALAGVYYQNSSGTMNHIETRFQQGTGEGIGILVQGAANSVTIENSNVHSFDSQGIQAGDNTGSTTQLTLNIEGNTVVGMANALAGIATNFGGSVTITGNIISGPSVPAGSSACTGGCMGMTIQSAHAGTVSNNTIVGSGSAGISMSGGVEGATMSVTSNKIFDISGDGIRLFEFAGAGPTVTNNVITQTQNGIDFNCNSLSGVNSNTISAIHSDGLVNVPASVTSTNTFINVPTNRSVGVCK